MQFGKRWALLVSSLGALLFVAIWGLDPQLTSKLTKEDGLVETVTMALFAATSLGCAYFAWRTPDVLRWYFVLWALLGLLFWGEEVSWGQRWIGFETPESLSSNVQGEANLHNLPWLTPRVVDSPTDFITSQGAFYLGFFAYFFLLPFVFCMKPFVALRERLQFPQEPASLMLAIWLPVVVSFCLALFTPPGPIRFALTETRECFFAFAIFLYVMLLMKQIREVDQRRLAAK